MVILPNKLHDKAVVAMGWKYIGPKTEPATVETAPHPRVVHMYETSRG